MKPKRKRQQRTVYTSGQIRVLEDKFWSMQYLTLQERADLAAQIGLSQTQVCKLLLRRFCRAGYWVMCSPHAKVAYRWAPQGRHSLRAWACLLRQVGYNQDLILISALINALCFPHDLCLHIRSKIFIEFLCGFTGQDMVSKQTIKIEKTSKSNS